MKISDLGKKFKKDEIIYEAVAYVDNPSMVLKDIKKGNTIIVVIDSEYANEFELVEDTPKVQVEITQEEYNKYLDSILDTPKEDKKYIEHIKMQENELHNHLNIIDKINEIIDRLNGE